MTTTDEREHDMQELLHRRADLVDVPGDFAPSAIARRRRDQRNRAVLGAVAAVAAVAVVVPAVWSRQGPGPSPAPATTTPTSVSSTSTSVPTQSATPPVTGSATQPPTTATSPPANQPPASIPTHDSDAAPATSRQLAFGAQDGSPEAAYAVAGVLYQGGQTLRLPVASGIRYLARLQGGGALVHAPVDGRPYSTYVVDPTGATLVRLKDVQDVRAKTDGSAFTTVDMLGTIHLYDSAGRQLSTFPTHDINAIVDGWHGDIVYHTGIEGDTLKTYAWDTGTGTDRLVTSGRFQAVHDDSGLAILWPNQEYRPDHTCYGLFDLEAGRVRWWSCGTFAPTHFGAGGYTVVGPEVADGPGTTTFKVASTDDGSIRYRVSLVGGAWSPAWLGADAKELVLTLLDRESPTRQVLAACSGDKGRCSIDSAPVKVSTTARDAMDWPIILSDN
jgi:hypothetical protein